MNCIYIERDGLVKVDFRVRIRVRVTVRILFKFEKGTRRRRVFGGLRVSLGSNGYKIQYTNL